MPNWYVSHDLVVAEMDLTDEIVQPRERVDATADDDLQV